METRTYSFTDRKQIFWKTVFYFSQGILAVWLILKSLGIIQTPFWLEYGVPVAGIIMTFFGFYHSMERSINKLGVGLSTLTVKIDHIDCDVNILKTDMKNVNSKVDRHEIKVDHLDKDVDFLKKRI